MILMKWIRFWKTHLMAHNNLLHGKSILENIVGIEIGTEGNAEIFQQNEDGTVSSNVIPNRYWILSPTPLYPFVEQFVKLEGSLHYKYGIQFSTEAEYKQSKNNWKYRQQKDIYSIANNEEALMVKDGYTFYKSMKPKEITLLSFDIETIGLNGYAEDAKLLLISTTYRDHLGITKNTLFAYDDYHDEKEMIEDFNCYVCKLDPSLIIGHNILGYDFPYLQARAELNGTELILGRNGKSIKFNTYDSKFRLDGTRDLLYKNVCIYGREIVDTYFLSNSFDVSKSMESYALKPMIKQLGFEKEGRQYYDAGSIRTNYTIPEEWAKIKQYAVEDAEDAVKLWDYMGGLYFNMAPMIPKPFSEILLTASGSKINSLMVRAYLQDGHSIPKATEMQRYEGAISFGVEGIYNNCFKIDLASLYPSIMIEYEVYDDEKDPKGYLLELVKTFRTKRLEYKRLAIETGDTYWKEMDTTAKGILNSFYGFCGAPGLQFNSLKCAEFITAKGREILEYTIQWASSKKLQDFIPDDEEEEEDVSA